MERNVFVSVRGLKKWFDLRESFLEAIFSREGRYVKAVDGITFDIHEGEVFGLVGESGCGKTTTSRLIMNQLELTNGKIYFEDIDLSTLKDKDELKKLTLKMQMIFQDPYDHISPWLSVYGTLAEPLRIHNMVKDKDEELSKIKEIMKIVELTPIDMLLPKYSYELSGGQRQRVIVARALLLNPKFLVADEPVSMLDISIRIGILNLLLELREKYALTILFITHDIAVARYISDRIGVMYLGKIIEMGPAETIIKKPLHPYTQALISAVPIPDPKIKNQPPLIKGTIPTTTDLPPGCRFNPRCLYVKDLCESEEPELIEYETGHMIACHFVHEIPALQDI